jgi:prepilin-type N-terminal cleavage/methylation domain-containing protein
MTRNTRGFTLVELVTVILIGSILVTIALSTFQSAQAQFAARSAKTMYATLHQRARSKAIEMGETVILFVNTTGDSALIVSSSGITDVTRFRSQLNVDLRSTPASFIMCMTPRGYSDPTCPAYAFTATTNTPITLEFWMNADSSTLAILPMGQLVGM